MEISSKLSKMMMKANDVEFCNDAREVKGLGVKRKVEPQQQGCSLTYFIVQQAETRPTSALYVNYRLRFLHSI